MKSLLGVCLAVLFLAAGNLCAATYSGGTGEPNNPYQIASAADLLELAANPGDFGAYFILTADIDLGSSGTFSAAVIGPDTSDFACNDHAFQRPGFRFFSEG